MTPKKKQPKPIPSPQRLKREAEALRANLARRKQQQRSRKADDDNNGSDNDDANLSEAADDGDDKAS
ncbi:hypothetical protein [Thalassospira sp.]|uniref:hypothetical protein n=1 Tax=Thalassospira sp. TaxID=1912094 RepID=UPI0027369C77|nr:hypothetical protein [Thalassospira sp.]MDP2696774.1 hypothetical protein [Thalassospira sp.]